jgi:hypothetical protein
MCARKSEYEQRPDATLAVVWLEPGPSHSLRVLLAVL